MGHPLVVVGILEVGVGDPWLQIDVADGDLGHTPSVPGSRAPGRGTIQPARNLGRVNTMTTRAALLGAASGLRSQFASGTAVLFVRPSLPFFARRPVRAAFGLAMAGEVVADQLPTIGSRLAPGPLTARVLLGAAAAGYLAWSRDRAVLPSAIVAAVGAVAAAKVGHDLRVSLAERYPPPAVGFAEDAVAAGLALAAIRPGRA